MKTFLRAFSAFAALALLAPCFSAAVCAQSIPLLGLFSTEATSENVLPPHADMTPNAPRERISLDGIWKFKIDPDDTGISEKWFGLSLDDSNWHDIKVPSTWNYFFRNSSIPSDGFDYDGIGWYRTNFVANESLRGKFAVLHFGAANYRSSFWLNGQYLGMFIGDCLPIEFDIGSKLNYGASNQIAVRLHPISHTEGGGDSMSQVPYIGQYGGMTGTVPRSFSTTSGVDWWNYMGLYRSVYLEASSNTCVYDIFASGTPGANGVGTMAVNATFFSTGGSKAYEARYIISESASGRVLKTFQKTETLNSGYASIQNEILVDSVLPWSAENPNLYILTVEIWESGQKLDSASVQFGFRTVETAGAKILINGQQTLFRGVNRHDEYPMMGRTQPDETYIADMEMMKNANVNALRTAHYPNSEQIYRIADKMGFYVFEEIPCWQLTIREQDDPSTRALIKQYMERMIIRDRNHPSIVFWSIGNEFPPSATETYQYDLYSLSRSLDGTRLVTYARMTPTDFAPELGDVVSINEYWGWYYGSNDILGYFLDMQSSAGYGKPVIITEWGADATPGSRTYADPATSPHFTEDYQCYHLKTHWDIAMSKDYFCGGFIWVFADFLAPTRKYLKSSQVSSDTINPVPYYNMKGIVDKDRVPKNSYLTVMGMYGADPVYNLTIEAVDESGNPISNATIDFKLESGALCGRQKTNAEGKTVLWYIPGIEYNAVATSGSISGAASINLVSDKTIAIKLSPGGAQEVSKSPGGIPGFDACFAAAAILFCAALASKKTKRR